MDSKKLAYLAAEACDIKKASDIKLIQIEKISSLTDWLVIASGLSDVQVKAITASVEDLLEEEANLLPIRKEGLGKGNWSLLDYGDLIVHIFQPELRDFYNLEAFWGTGIFHNFLSTEN